MTLPEAIAQEPWFCDCGDFWGTIYQFCRCARCGSSERKRHDEPRHWGGLFTSKLHTICDECFDLLPDEATALAALPEGARHG